MSTILVQIKDYMNSEYDIFVLAPEGMPTSEAVSIVDEVVLSAKLGRPTEYEFNDIEAALTSQGFTFPERVCCNELY